MKRAWSGFCLLAALCGLTTAAGLAEPLHAANPEGAGTDNAHCPYIQRMFQGCFRGDGPFYPEGDLGGVEEELPYLPAPLFGPFWGDEDGDVGGGDAIDHEWEVYRLWREGLWYHEASLLPEPTELDLALALADSLRGELVRLYAEAARELADRNFAVGATIAIRVDPSAAIAEPHDIYATEYYRLPGDEPAAEEGDWGYRDYDEEGYSEAENDAALDVGANEYWDALEGGYEDDTFGGTLGQLDDYIWGRPIDEDAEADLPWYVRESEEAAESPAEAPEATEAGDDQPAETLDAIPYEPNDDYSFSYSDVLRRLYERSAALLCPGEMNGFGGQWPLAPEQAKLAAPEAAAIAEGYAAEYVPEYEAPSEEGFWAEGSVEEYNDGTSEIPYREDLDPSAYPESDESWDTSPLESALHNEVRPMTRGLAAGQGAELLLPLAW